MMEFRVLGPLEVTVGRLPVPIGRGKQRAILALLILNAGRMVSSERLIDEIWGERPPATGPKALHVYVSRLRKALGPGVIVTRPPGYQLAIEAEQVDARRFEDLLQAGRDALGRGEAMAAAETLRAALELWRGPVLADVAYEPFAQSEIMRLEALFLAAVEERIEADLALGCHPELVGELEGLVAEHPLRERLRGQLMLALYRSGRQAEALDAYQAARRALVDELGIEPSAPLKELERGILNQDAALDPPLMAPGTAADDSPTPEPKVHAEERKLVTIFFAEFETQLDGEPDPERMRAFFDRVRTVAVEELETAGGTVERSVAEELLVTFGAPTAQEDHVERALHAALAAQRRIRDVLHAAPGLRIGIESGEVLVRAAGTGEASLAGQPVVSAVRLARRAAPGEVVVGERAAQAAGASFEMRDRDGSYVLLEELAPARRRGVPALGRTFVGRQPEVDLLVATHDRVIGASEPHLVTIVGEAGIGKTSLVRALREQLPPTLHWHLGRCPAYGRGITYRPLADILRHRLGLMESDPPEVVQSRLSGREILGLTLGLESAEKLHPWEARERLREAWVDLLEDFAREGPAAVVVEDLHWADDALLELLEQATAEVGGPLLLIATARPELLGQRPGWGAGRRNASRLWLEPLPSADASRMLEQLAGDLPGAVRAHVLERAEGNPFFVEEVLDSLMDYGVLRREGGGWRATDLPPTLQVADSVQAVIEARIDLLPSPEKAALQAASVIGRTFWEGPVRALSGASEADFRLLDEREFARRRPKSTLGGEREYVFKHALTREVTYGTLPLARRVCLHAGFAEWLERAGRGRDDHAPLIAHHYAQAAEPEHADLAWQHDSERAAAVRSKAVGWLRRAGELAVTRFEIDAALALLEHAHALASDDSTRAQLLQATADAYRARFDMEDFRSALEDALALGPTPQTAAEIYAELAFQGGQAYKWRQPPARELVETWVERTLELSDAEEPRAKALSGRVLRDPASGQAAADEVLALAKRVGDPTLIGRAYETQFNVATAAGAFDEALKWADREIALAPKIADPDQRGSQYLHPTFGYLRVGRVATARRLAEEYDATCGRLTSHHEVHAVSWRLLVEVLAGRFDDARALTRRAEEAAAANEETPCQFNWRSLLMAALACAHAGEDREARRLEEVAAEAMSVNGPLSREPALLRLALLRADSEAVERLLAEDPGADFFDVDYEAARLDALASLGERQAVEREAPPVLQRGGYGEPFALRALGMVREDRALLDQATARFEALGLAWRANERAQWPS
jgi:DNA-binding SARP family transcriptional activator/class 3 adenylate cyclase/tetratricopeptide (TPR) repeat protein